MVCEKRKSFDVILLLTKNKKNTEMLLQEGKENEC